MVRVVCARYGMDEALIADKTRTRSTCEPRWLCQWFAVTRIGATMTRIGEVSGRDYSTVSTGVRSLEKKLKRDPRFAALVEEIWAEICAQPDGPPELETPLAQITAKGAA